MLDLKARLTTAISLAIAARSSNTEVNGTAVSLGGYNSAVAIVTTGTITDGTHTIKLEESNDGGSTWSDVASTDLDGAFTVVAAANDDALQTVGYKGSAGQIRATVTDATSTTGGILGVNIVLSDEQHVGGSPVIT